MISSKSGELLTIPGDCCGVCCLLFIDPSQPSHECLHQSHKPFLVGKNLFNIIMIAGSKMYRRLLEWVWIISSLSSPVLQAKWKHT